MVFLLQLLFNRFAERLAATIKPDVLLLNQDLSPWQPQAFSTATAAGVSGVISPSADSSQGGITLVTNDGTDVYAFQAVTAGGTSVNMNVFEGPQFFDFQAASGESTFIATAAPIFTLSTTASVLGNSMIPGSNPHNKDLFNILEQNLDQDINNDGSINAVSSSSSLAASAYTTNVITSSTNTSVSLNSPAIFSGEGGFLIWHQSADNVNQILGTTSGATNNNFFLLAASASNGTLMLETWSASGSLTLTGAYRENLLQQPDELTQYNPIGNKDQGKFSLVFDTNTSTSLGSVYSTYSFVEHSSISSILVQQENATLLARDLESLEVSLGYDITGDGLVGNTGLTIQTALVQKSSLLSTSSSTNLLQLSSGEYAVDSTTSTVGQPASGKLLLNSSSSAWAPSTGASPVGIYKINASTLSAQETFVIIQKDASTKFFNMDFFG